VDQHKLILYADDDTDDKLWVSEACKAINCGLKIQFVENGKQALDYLRQIPTADKLPSLIVLDLNMPELDGRQTLKQLKMTPEYQSIPVAIVTTSSNKMDKEICTRLGASVYLTKPDTHDEWQNIVRKLQPFAN
jgi:CheY-like chemotaxis protein